jgi:4-hydroxy 2-oxovalerate aldolase
MSNIKILDCTLRDGGYVNNFQFGKNAITKIIRQLTEANIDIIECGFLEDCEYDENTSIFNHVEEIVPFIPKERKNSMYVAMACYGEYSLDKLSIYDGTSIDGIRMTFHYNEIDEALDYCRQIQAKGYKLFVQPVGTTSYTDEQLLALIKKVNEIQPYSFYLVDTLGLMNSGDVMRMFYLINHNLGKGINMGFHSHNNLQLSFSNCQQFLNVETERNISLDSSVYGMGRGAGNLNTELIANYLNDHQQKKYGIDMLLEIIDEFIIHIKQKYEWGYSVPYYLAAINGCHPNYASYLSNKQTLTVKSISTILRMIEQEQRALFSKEVVEEKYRKFQERNIDDTLVVENLSKNISGKNVILMAPGQSLLEYRSKILALKDKEKCVVISVSFVPDFMNPDFVFLSNSKRYNTTFNPTEKPIHLIHTSNIQTAEDEHFYSVNYHSLLNEEEFITDNSAIMALTLLLKLKPAKVYLAGLDGYNPDKANYYEERLNLIQDRERTLAQNRAMKKKIGELSKELNVKFVTSSLYNNLND